MTSAPTAGYQAIFKLASTAMIQVQSIDLTINGMAIDITIMNGLTTPAWKAMLAGLKDWSIKVVGFYDQVNDAVQASLWANFLTSTTCAISFSLNAGVNAFTGNAIITAIPIKAAVAAADSVEIDFTGTGALAYA